jgi:phospholipid/cholesterol/gamma-HCH transport system substrate-binding protein
MPRTRSLAWSELKLGIVGVIALVLAAAIILAIGGEGGFFAEYYPLKARFDDVLGLKPGAVVRLNGMEVGTVEDVEFAGTQVDVIMEVRDELRPLITTSSIASIGSISLLGEPIVDITAASGPPLPDWGYVRAGPAGGPFGELTATAAESLEEVEALVADIRAGRGTLGRLITDDTLYAELNRLVGAAADVSEAIQEGEGTLPRLINDPAAYESLRGSLENLQTMTARINAGEGALGRFLNDQTMGQSFANTMTNMEQVTAGLREGEGTLGRLMTDEQVFDRLNSVMGRMDQVVAGLETGEGTAGRLLRDPELYENINRTMTELRSLVADIRADPRRFLNVRVSIF